jgi:hypothetical protein
MSFAQRLADWVLETEKPITPERLGRVYNKLYGRAAGVIQQHQPCRIQPGPEGAICAACGREADINPGDLCCRACKHHSKELGCQAEDPLACRSWLCAAAAQGSPEAARRLRDIERRGLKARLWHGRQDKPTSIAMAQLANIGRRASREP